MILSLLQSSNLENFQNLLQQQVSKTVAQEQTETIGLKILENNSTKEADRGWAGKLIMDQAIPPSDPETSRLISGMKKLLALGRDTIAPLDICYAFNIHDSGIAQAAIDPCKGITTIESYHSVLLAEEDSEKINRNISVFSELFDSSKGLAFYSVSKKELYFFKKEDDQLKYCRQSISKQEEWNWLSFGEDQLKSLDLQDTDWLITLGPEKLKDFDKLFYREETPEHPINGHFFSQAQESVNEDNSCGAHSINAFFGKKVTSLEDQFNFTVKTLKDEDYDLLSNVYENDGGLDVTKGTNPDFLVDYLNYFSAAGTTFKNFKSFAIMREPPTEDASDYLKRMPNLNQLSSFLPSYCDRVIVGLKNHWVAIRKNVKLNTWHIIDSLWKESQETAYKTIEEAIKNYGRLGDRLNFIYSDHLSTEPAPTNFTSFLKPFKQEK